MEINTLDSKPSVTPIEELKPGVASQVIEIKVYRTWIVKDFRDHTPTNYCCMLIDKQGNGIQGNIDYNEYRTLSKILQQNAAYIVYDFVCEKNISWQRTLPTKTSLKIGSYTKFYRISNDGFPNHCFNFADYETVQSRATYNTPILTGRIHHVGEMQRNRRIVDIINLRNQIIPLILWDDQATNFDIDSYNNCEKPVIIAVSSCWANYFLKQLQLKSTTATYYYFNPEISEYYDSIEEYKVQEIEHPTINLNADNTHSLSQVIAMTLGTYRARTFICECTIESIDYNKPWFYLACPTCKVKVGEEINRTTICVNHGSTEEPQFCYSFRIIVSDNNTTAGVTFMQNKGDSLIDHSCRELVLQMGYENQKQIPPPIQAIEKSKHTFQIRNNPGSKSTITEFFGIGIVAPTITDSEATFTPPHLEALEVSTTDTPTEKTTNKETTSKDKSSTNIKRVLFDNQGTTTQEAKKKKE